jgi:hypothetical protein
MTNSSPVKNGGANRREKFGGWTFSNMDGFLNIQNLLSCGRRFINHLLIVGLEALAKALFENFVLQTG